MRKVIFAYKECLAVLKKNSLYGRHCHRQTNNKILEYLAKIISVCIIARLKANKAKGYLLKKVMRSIIRKSLKRAFKIGMKIIKI